LEGFAAVGDALSETHGARIILFGETVDAPLCKAVAERMRYPVIDLSGQTTLGQFVGMLGRLKLVICNDGGPLHLAVSQRVRTVSIFGPVDPVVYGPYPHDPSHHVVCREGLPCRPCYHQFKLPPCPYERACLTTVEPDEVIGACVALLEAPRLGASPVSRHA
jgi:heptosyltransferase-2